MKRVKCSAIFALTNKTIQRRPPVFSVNGSIIWQFAPLLTSLVQYRKVFFQMWSKQWLVMMNYACDFSQSETEKYSE